MIELVSFGQGEDPDDGALVGGGGKESSRIVDGDVGEGSLVCRNHIYRFQLGSIKHEDVAGRRWDMCTGWRRVGWGRVSRRESFLGKWIGEVAFFR